MEKRPHMQPGKCPGRDFFERKESTQKEEMRELLVEVIGEVPKYMRIAGENRIWLWMLSALVVIDTGLVISALIIISKI